MHNVIVASLANHDVMNMKSSCAVREAAAPVLVMVEDGEKDEMMTRERRREQRVQTRSAKIVASLDAPSSQCDSRVA